MAFCWVLKAALAAFEKGFALISHLGVIAEHRLPRLVLMTGALVRGGMEMQFLDLAREHNQRGGEVIVIGDSGPMEKIFSEFGSVVIVPHPFSDSKKNIDAILSQIDSHCICAIALQSSYFSLIPLLAARCRVLICAHNRPGTFENWLRSQSLIRLGELFRALEADGRLQISASSRSNAERHAISFGLHNDTVKAWYPAIGKTSVGDIKPDSEEFRIGVIARLSPEKLLLAESALILLQEAHSQGVNARLIIAGIGGAEAVFKECIERSGLSSYVDFIGESTDPVATCRGFDVTVANGRVALEALAAGSRLVTVSVEKTERPELRIHSVAMLENIEYLADENFAPPLGDGQTAKIWPDIFNLDNIDRKNLQSWVFNNRSSTVLYEEFIDRMNEIQIIDYNSKLEEFLCYNQAEDDAMMVSTIRHDFAEARHRTSLLEDELTKAQEWIKEQRDAIDWLSEQRDIWEKNAQEFSQELANRTA